jgi:MYXO-CTERM domain-containing protein
MRVAIAGLIVLVAGAAASADVAFWDTGAPTPVNFNGTDTNLGYSSGNLGTGSTQRWAAQAFTVPAGVTTITQVDADWFDPSTATAMSNGANVAYRIFPRPSTASAPVPGSEVASGILGAYGPGVDDPRVAGAEIWLHSYTGLNIAITPGDYWITIYSDGLGVGNTTGTSNLAWLTGAAGVDASVTYNNFMWRSATYPAPGFAAYSPAAVQPSLNQTDPTDRWNTSFTLYTVPGPGGLALVGLGGLALARRRRA